MNEKQRIRSANELRQFLLNDCEEVVQAAFKKHRALKSIALVVAQYWNDEADDAVHGRLLCSELETPDVGAALIALDGGEGDDDYYDEMDYVNLPSFTLDGRPEIYPKWNSNEAGIPAFAAYCTEGGDQCSPAQDNYSLYAIFYRDGRVKTVGTKVRPYLDGHPEEMLLQNLEWLSTRSTARSTKRAKKK
ncbi:MAG: hypothetical protein AB8H86_16920 [Polyangiales bacterium]